MPSALVNFLGSLGALLSFGLQTSPMPTMIRGVKEMDIKSITLSYHVMASVQSMFWFNYGLGRQDPYIWGVNLIGITLFLIYANMFIYIKGPTKHYLYVDAGVLAQFLIGHYVLPYQWNMIGAVIVACFWQTATIPTMRLALKNKDGSFVDILLAIVSFANFVDWILYSLLTETYLMGFQNFVCGFFCFFNIYIYFWTQGKMPDKDCLIEKLKEILKSDEVETPSENAAEKNLLVNNEKKDFNYI